MILWTIRRKDFKVSINKFCIKLYRISLNLNNIQRVLTTIGSESLSAKIETLSKVAHFKEFSKIEMKKVAACLSEEFFGKFF